jgi:integrase/recombinase XerD
VRHLTADVETTGSAGDSRRVSPHVWRHTAAVHLLESGYAEITMCMKTEAIALCSPTGSTKAAPWNYDPSLLNWLTSL